MSIKLNDTQLVLLNSAARRDDRCALVPAGAKRAQAMRAVSRLQQLGFLKEVRAQPFDPSQRDQDRGRHRNDATRRTGDAL